MPRRGEPADGAWPAAVLVAVVLLSIGSPLLGLRAFAATDVVYNWAPWRSEAPVGFRPANEYVIDTVDAALPMRAELRRHVHAGRFPLWTTLPAGGTPLGAVPTHGALSPLNLPYLLVPLWYAPGLAKLLEMAVAAGFMHLFLRRVGLGRAAALVGALVYVNSGFQVVWTNWPQAHIGALIPALFWAVELALARHDGRAAAPLGVVTAVMWLEGFPAVTVYALLAAGAYALSRFGAARVRAGHRGQEAPAPPVAGLAAALAGVLLGAALAAIQLLPFAHQLEVVDFERRVEASAGAHLPPRALVTMAVPDAFGSPADGVRYADPNYVELQSFVGVAALGLALLALTRRSSRRCLDGVRAYLLAGAGVAIAVIYLGGPLLDILQAVPLLEANFVGRARAVLGFLLAAAAAVGFQHLLTPVEEAAAGWRRLVEPLGWAAVLALAGAALARLLVIASAAGRREYLLDQLLVPGAVAVVFALVLVAAALLRRHPARRAVVLAVVPLLVAVESLAFARPFWPRVPVDQFYPVTSTHAFLAEHLGAERLAAEQVTLFPGTTTFYELRSVTAHAFMDPPWRQLLAAVDPDAFALSATFPFLGPGPQVATSPILDRLAARYFVAAPDVPVPGHRLPLAPSDPLRLGAGGALRVALPRADLRALVVTLQPPLRLPQPGRLVVRVHDADGRLLARGHRRLDRATPPGAFQIPLVEPAAGGANGPASAEVRLEAEPGAAVDLAPAQAVTATGDGLRTVFVDGAVVLERGAALPRFRWASRFEHVPAAGDRLARLAAGVRADTVLLHDPGPRAAGVPAAVRPLRDGPDELVVEVDAGGPGYLVVADALQRDWHASVDGRSVLLHDADHALVAVHVPAGVHTVRLTYDPPGWDTGRLVSAAAALVLLGLFVPPSRRSAARTRTA